MRVQALAICYTVVLCVGGVLILVITRPGVVPGPWEPAIRGKTSSSPKNRAPVTMVVVTCATRLELTMNNLKSAVAFSRAPLRLLLYADVENIKRLQDWKCSVM